MQSERCPKCGADQTNKNWFVGEPNGDGTYQAVCFDCRARNVWLSRHGVELVDIKPHANLEGNKVAQVAGESDAGSDS